MERFPTNTRNPGFFSNVSDKKCPICFNICSHPVKCLSCRTEFCFKCTKNFDKCPLCDFYPFKVMNKSKFNKVMTAIALIKMSKFAKEKRDLLEYDCFCSLCNFKCSKNEFLEHIVNKHKNMAIDVFNKQCKNDDKQKLLTQMFNQLVKN